MNRVSAMSKEFAAARNRGFSLIEVLIAVLVLAIGLLGLAALQATALRNNQSALERSQGVMNTYTILDAMRANVGPARSGEYQLARTCTVPAAADGSAATLAAADKRRWMQTVHENLGDAACGAIACTGDLCTVTVEWSDDRAKGGDAAYKFETEVRL